MKKAIPAAMMALVLAAAPFAGGIGAQAEQADRQVYADAGTMIQWAQSTEWVDEGLAVYAGQWEGGGFSMFFDVSDGKEVNVKFKVPVYEENGTAFVTENGSMYSKYIVDMIVESFDNNGMAVLRLWGDSGSSPDAVNVAAKITCGDLHGETNVTRPDAVAENVWVQGVMRGSSEFDISFNTTDFFKAVWGDTQGAKQCLLTASDTVTNGAAVKETLTKAFCPEGRECKTVQVFFRLSAQCSNGGTCPKTGCAEHDPNAMSKMIVTEVNGQSLANTQGLLTDTTPPFVAPVRIRGNREININTPYALEVQSSPRDAGSEAFYCEYASDILSNETLSFSAKIVAPSGKETMYSSYDAFSDIRFEELGTHKITVTVRDAAGNSYTTPETPVEAVRGFELTIDGYAEGDTLSMTLGESLTLPSATATDKTGAACAVSIRVENPYGKEVALGEGNTFTPESQGVYKAIYSAVSGDGASTKTVTLRIAVRQEEKKGGCGSSLNGGAPAGGILLSLALLLGAAGAACALRRRKRK